MTTLLFDYDPILYEVGSVGESRTIKVVHRTSGDEHEFSTRTAFWGHWKKKAGGWLAEYNSARSEDQQRPAEEWDVTDVQTPEPIEFCLRTMKSIIRGHVEAVGAKSYYGYSGKGKVFREEISTILKYKGNREGALRPLHLEELKVYLAKHHNCEVVTVIEADDACSIDSYSAWQKWAKSKSDDDKLVLAYVDKDYLQCAGHIYNTNYRDGIDSYGDGFGWLTLEKHGKSTLPKGRGRLWLYFQVLSEDTSDNYCANSANPSVKWGPMAAYEALKDCKSDKEALQVLVNSYKRIYPSKRSIIGWRGYEDPKDMKILKPDAEDFRIELDFMDVLVENFHLARMLRWRDDYVDVRKVIHKLGVEL